MSKLRHTVHTSRTIADNLIFCGTSKPLEIQGQFLGPVNRKASSICPRKVQKDSSGLKPGECVQLCSGLSFQVMMKSGGQSPCFPFSVESNIGNPRNVPTPGQSRAWLRRGESSFSRKALYGYELEFSFPSFLHFCNTSKGKGSLHTASCGFSTSAEGFQLLPEKKNERCSQEQEEICRAERKCPEMVTRLSIMLLKHQTGLSHA